MGKSKVLDAAETRPSVTSKKTVFILAASRIFPDGFERSLGRQAHLKVCGKEVEPRKALAAISALRPDLAIVQVPAPGERGIKLLKHLRAKNRRLKLLVLSNITEAAFADRVLRAGADGYLIPQEDTEEIVYAVNDVLSGHLYLSEDVLEAQSLLRKTSGKKQRAKGNTPLTSGKRH